MLGDRQGEGQRNKCCITYTISPFFTLQKVEIKTLKCLPIKCINYHCTGMVTTAPKQNKASFMCPHPASVVFQCYWNWIYPKRCDPKRPPLAKMGGTASGCPSVNSGFAHTHALPRRWLGLTHTKIKTRSKKMCFSGLCMIDVMEVTEFTYISTLWNFPHSILMTNDNNSKILS